MKKNKYILALLVFFVMCISAQNAMSAFNQISLSFGFKHDNRGSTKFLASDSEEGILGNFTYSLQYTRFLKSNIGVGLDFSFSRLGHGENNAEGDVSTIPALINFRYYWLRGKIRPYSKISGGVLMGLTAKSEGNELYKYNEPKNDSGAGSEKYKLNLGYAGGSFVGVDWLFFKGLGINIETGILYENLHDKMLTNGKLSSTSFLSRIGILYQF